jgi:hypothetical protein
MAAPLHDLYGIACTINNIQQIQCPSAILGWLVLLCSRFILLLLLSRSNYV